MRHNNEKYYNSNPSGPNLSEQEKQVIRNYIIDLLGNDPINCVKDIVHDRRFGSLRTISGRLGISRPTFRAYISTWLEILYGKAAVEEVIKLIWPEKSAKQKEKIRFNEIIEKYIRLYPKRTYLIPTRNDLLKGELHGIISKNTFKPWVIDYLIQVKRNNPDVAQEIYDRIWGDNCAIRKKNEYNDIKSFIQHRDHESSLVLTSKIDFNLMTEFPTERYVKILCKERHEFSIKVRKLIYDYNWCPYCNELLCERLMRTYLEKFFKSDFKPQVRFEEACGINKEEFIIHFIKINRVRYFIPVSVGKLRYDHFCSNVCVEGNDGTSYQFTIAGEYDGFYHDEKDIKNNPFCDSMEDYAAVKARDYLKNDISYKKKTILIRLKEKDGFTRKTLLKNQKRVIQETALQFNEQAKTLFGLNNVQMRYDPLVKFDPLGYRRPTLFNGSLDRFLEI